MNKKETIYWSKKPRTLFRFIKQGDIFMFRLNEAIFGVGRIMTKVSIGHIAEILHIADGSQEITIDMIVGCKRVAPPTAIDSYGLFDRKIEGDWRIVGRDNSYSNPREDFFFKYGAAGDEKIVDLFGNIVSKPISVISLIPFYSPKSDSGMRDYLRNFNVVF